MTALLKPSRYKSSEITPEEVYLSRRQLLKVGGVLAAGFALAACAPVGTPQPTLVNTSLEKDELGNSTTPYESITNYNNYYEFTTDKTGVAALSAKFTTNPWQVEVSGLVNKPKTFGLEDIMKGFTQEERIYRLRCVEGWSMVIPWQGFSLADLLKQVEPTSSAKFVSFETVYRPKEMPGQIDVLYPWPYVEGLRLDEAMNSLTTLATGIYGKDLLPANGAPIRLVVPWKYGFKSIKSIIKISLTDKMPKSFWNEINPMEYGFYSNVNPDHPHPRWSQSSERRIGETQRIPTLMFNGYSSQVSDIYKGMDLNENY
jgi:methionine sulfoxide reductase catalytic subunit